MIIWNVIVHFSHVICRYKIKVRILFYKHLYQHKDGVPSNCSFTESCKAEKTFSGKHFSETLRTHFVRHSQDSVQKTSLENN